MPWKRRHARSSSILRFRPYKNRCVLTTFLSALLLCLTAAASGEPEPAWRARPDAAEAGRRVIAVGQRGRILLSDDGGGNAWRQAPAPVRALLTAVHMHDAATGWAVGHDAVILRTEDAGESWRLAHRAPEEERPLLDVWFRDRDTGFAVGAYRYFLATPDGGANRVSRAISQDDFHLNAIHLN